MASEYAELQDAGDEGKAPAPAAVTSARQVVVSACLLTFVAAVFGALTA